MSGPNPRYRLYGSSRDYWTIAARMAGGRWDRGDEVVRLEAEMQRRASVPYAICTAKARVAIFLAIRAIVRPGQKVVLSPYTISDVVNMVVCAGGVPVFADIDETTCNIDANDVASLMDADVGAVLATHLHGLACEMDRLQEACARGGTALIEDAAQAIGTAFNGQPVGTFGAAGILSFGMYKNVNMLFGGMLLTRDPNVAARVRREVDSFPAQERGYYLSKVASAAVADLATFPPFFRGLTFPLLRASKLLGLTTFDRATSFDHAPLLKRTLPETYLRRMTPTQASLGLRQLDSVREQCERRIVVARRYHQALADVSGIALPPLRTDFSHTYTYFPIQVDDRERILRELFRLGRDIGAQHLRNCADLECFAPFYRDCPVARRVARRVVLLPTYPRYGEREVERTIAALRTIYGA